MLQIGILLVIAILLELLFFTLPNFERDLSNWDVSSVTDDVFHFWVNCTSFTGQGLDTWVTSALTNLQSTFQSCTTNNGNLPHFDVSGVTTMAKYVYLY